MLRPSQTLPAFTLASVVCCVLGQARPGRVQHSEQAVQPYTAEYKITTVQTLADGTTITVEETEIRARDWQGRMMESTTRLTPNEAARAGWTSVHVNDLAENTQSDWNSFTMRGNVIKYPPRDQRHGCWANEAGNMRATYSAPVTPAAPAQGTTPAPKAGAIARTPRPKSSTEDLGTQNILGVEAQGRRETITIPVAQIGNDRPIATVYEFWSAINLDLPTLREIRDDPRAGKRTREIVRLDLTDPDSALFQPPANYEIKREELHQVPCER